MTHPPGAAYPPQEPGQPHSPHPPGQPFAPQSPGQPYPAPQSPGQPYPAPQSPGQPYPAPQSPGQPYPAPQSGLPYPAPDAGHSSPVPQPGQPYPGPYGSPPGSQSAQMPYGSPYGFAPRPPAPGGWQPERVDQVTGTGFGLVHMQVPPITSGPAIGSLMAGIVAILVSFAVLCFGLMGAEEGWGALVAGAFTLLGVLAGGGAVAAAMIARRRIAGTGEKGRVRFTGRGLSVGGLVCGLAGAGLSLTGLVLGLVLQLT